MNILLTATSNSNNAFEAPVVSGLVRSVSLRTVADAVRAVARHLAQLPFLGELAAERAEVRDQVAAGLDERGAWRHFAIGLHAQLKRAARGRRQPISGGCCEIVGRAKGGKAISCREL